MLLHNDSCWKTSNAFLIKTYSAIHQTRCENIESCGFQMVCSPNKLFNLSVNILVNLPQIFLKIWCLFKSLDNIMCKRSVTFLYTRIPKSFISFKQYGECCFRVKIRCSKRWQLLQGEVAIFVRSQETVRDPKHKCVCIKMWYVITQRSFEEYEKVL